ncbi:MAG: hypothetical protein AB1403_08645 [Candidatus Riflebacteria bacterium]
MKKSMIMLAIAGLLFPIAGFAAEIVFSGQKDNQFDLYKANLEDGAITQLTGTPAADELMACLSPDRTKIAFVSDRQGANSLYLAAIDAIDKAENISPAVGAYANPVFSADSTRLLAKYAPDPELPFAKTKIIVLDLQKKQQDILIDSEKLTVPENSETLKVVDWPVWISEDMIVYVLSELADDVSGRTTRSTLYMFDRKNNKHIRMGGGESYFTDTGRNMGFKATMPTLINESDKLRYLVFAAVRGNIEREPMQLSLTGSGKGGIELGDPDFFGPLLIADQTWIYGVTDDDGINRLHFKKGQISAAAQKLQFDGAVIYPTLLKP